LRALENRVLRIILSTRRGNNSDWRRLCNVELHNLYPSPNIIMAIKSKSEMGRACSTNGKDEKCIQNIDWKV
jgi:hypothetical protein